MKFSSYNIPDSTNEKLISGSIEGVTLCSFLQVMEYSGKDV